MKLIAQIEEDEVKELIKRQIEATSDKIVTNVEIVISRKTVGYGMNERDVEAFDHVKVEFEEKSNLR